MERGAWWATVHEVAKSWTQLLLQWTCLQATLHRTGSKMGRQPGEGTGHWGFLTRRTVDPFQESHLGVVPGAGSGCFCPTVAPPPCQPNITKEESRGQSFPGAWHLRGGSQSVWSRHGCWGIPQSCGRHSGDNTVVLPSFCDGAVSVSCFLVALCGMWDVDSLTRDQTCAPLQWKRRVLTTGLPGKSLLSAF